MADLHLQPPVAKQSKRYDQKYHNLGRPPRFNLELCGDVATKAEIHSKLKEVKSLIAGKGDVNNTDTIRQLLDYFLIHHKEKDDQPSVDIAMSSSTTYTRVEQEEVDQPIFMTSLNSIDSLTRLAAEHGQHCKKPSLTSEIK